MVPKKTRDPGDLAQGTRDVTKKIRLTPREAELLSELAEARGTNQSEVLRKGLRLVDRMRQRAENIDGLIELAQGEEPEKVRFKLDG